MTAFQTGLAIKRSRYGSKREDRRIKTQQNALLATSIGYDYIIFDFEGEKFDITPSELPTILENAKGSSKIIVTMASRADSFDIQARHSKLQQFIEIANSFDNLGFSIVAGNPAYLSCTEKQKRITSMIELSQYISERNQKVDIFIGTENCMGPTLEILRSCAIEQGYKHTYIPFILKSETSSATAESITNQFHTKFTCALYTPYLNTQSFEEVTRSLYKYILRRTDVKEELPVVYENFERIPEFNDLDLFTRTTLHKYAKRLSVFGDFTTISNELINLYREGFGIIVGLTLADVKEQVLYLKMACLRTNELLTIAAPITTY